MKIKNQVSLQRLIGKVDNDFNISESDWIPRVGAWVIDALSQMKCLPLERKRKVLEVSDRIATYPCEITAKELKVFDNKGCEIPDYKHYHECKCSEIGGKLPVSEIGVYKPNATSAADTIEIVNVVDKKRRYYILDGRNIELNFDTDQITIELFDVATYHDDYFDCEVPYIYDNGLLIEALAWYILFKYLSRGSKHQVYSLTSPNPVLNPYTQWNTLRAKAITSVKVDMMKNTDGWRNFFYNSTFDPRR
jgi:hypothetical protein